MRGRATAFSALRGHMEVDPLKILRACATRRNRNGPFCALNDCQDHPVGLFLGDQTTMAYVDAAGARLYVEESGHGYPVIFLHEFGSDRWQWEAQIRHFGRAYRCITFNARGYPPSEVPEDATAYGWELAIEDVAAVMQALALDRAHIIGLSMGGYTALLFGLRYPEKVSAIVAAAVGSGSLPSHRSAWLKETSTLARAFMERGMDAMAERIAHGPTRIQLKYKDQRTWQAFLAHLRQQSPRGMANTMVRCQALRPPLHDLQN